MFIGSGPDVNSSALTGTSSSRGVRLAQVSACSGRQEMSHGSSPKVTPV